MSLESILDQIDRMTAGQRAVSRAALVQQTLQKDPSDYTLTETLASRDLTENEKASYIYSRTGVTFIDRLLSGYSIITQHSSDRSSNYEMMIDSIKQMDFQSNFIDRNHESFIEERKTTNLLLRMVTPWLQGVPSVNIQIDNHLAYSLIDANKKDQITLSELIGSNFFIDIKPHASKERFISAIACEWIDTKDKEGLQITFVIEWSREAFESVNTVFIPKNKMSRKVDEGIDVCIGPLQDASLQDVTEWGYDVIPYDVIRLIGASWSLCHTSDSDSHDIPLITSKAVTSLNKGKQKAKLKTHSFFKFKSIRPAMVIGSGKESWTLSHLVTVSGHFKMQAHGKNNSLRKLIWVDHYEKGSGSEVRPGVGHSMKVVK